MDIEQMSRSTKKTSAMGFSTGLRHGIRMLEYVQKGIITVEQAIASTRELNEKAEAVADGRKDTYE